MEWLRRRYYWGLAWTALVFGVAIVTHDDLATGIAGVAGAVGYLIWIGLGEPGSSRRGDASR